MIRVTEEAVSNRTLADESIPAAVEQLARQRLLADCECAYFFSEVTFQYADGVLTLRGRVPTQALRHVLDTLLADIEEVSRVENQVDVISSTGLSRIHSK